MGLFTSLSVIIFLNSLLRTLAEDWQVVGPVLCTKGCDRKEMIVMVVHRLFFALSVLF